MKKITALVAILIIGVSCQETQKIVFVDNAKVYEEYQEKIDIEAKITKRQEDFKKKTDSIAMAYQMEAAPLQAKFNNLSQQQQQTNPEIIAFSQKWQMVESQIKAQEQSMQTQVENDLKELDAHVEDFVANYAQKNNIAFILGKNKSGSLMYGSAASDVTDAVIKELNDGYKSKDKSETTSSDTATATDKTVNE